MDRSSSYFSSRTSRRRPSNANASQSLSVQDSRPAKRPRLNHSDSATSTTNTQTQSEEDSSTEFIDLREYDDSTPLAKALSKQREDAVKAQQVAEHEKGRSLLTAYRCPVCMEAPVDATITVCGHLFCHKCIIDTLKFSESQRTDTSGKSAKGSCPVCRKSLARIDAPSSRRTLIPLELKLVTKKRGEAAAGSSR